MSVPHARWAAPGSPTGWRWPPRGRRRSPALASVVLPVALVQAALYYDPVSPGHAVGQFLGQDSPGDRVSEGGGLFSCVGLARAVIEALRRFPAGWQVLC